MSSSRSGEAEEALELLLQERLQILLERLRWSYAALWTLDPHTRVLQWKRGHYSSQVHTSKAATTRATSSSQPKLTWFAQHFYAAYKSCSFSPGTGFVGRANLGGRPIWLSGDSVCQNAGSLEQSQFLSYAKIKTVMCIPWVDSVLEVGTTNFVGENFQLMDQIQQVLSHDLLSVPSLHEDDVAPGIAGHDSTANSSQAVAATLQHQHAQSTVVSLQLPDPALDQPGSFQSAFDINMSDQVWRSDIVNFMQEQDSLPDLAAVWTAIGAGDNQTRHKNINIAQPASASHGLMNLSQDADQYRSCTNSFAGTTHAAATASSSTSVSSHGDQYSNSSSATRATNSMSPELLHQHIMQALSPPISVISHSTAPDRTSSTARLAQAGELHLEAYSTIKHEQDATGAPRINQNNNLRRTTSCSDQYEIQRALSLFEAQEMQDQWRQQGLNPVTVQAADLYIMDTHDQSNVSFNSWKHGQDPTLNSNISNQTDMDIPRKKSSKIPRAGQLQRRHTLAAMDVLKEVETYEQEAANSNMINSSVQDYFQIRAESQPAVRSDQMQMNTRNLRGRPRAGSSSRGSGAAAGHDEAALNHMMAERRRRVKQKENFSILRRLVPLISKADKASTLEDAIVYLKDLQNTIVEMKASEDDMVQRCEDLASRCTKLEEQNKELVAILSKDKSAGEVVHLNILNLHSMKSL
ncbi:hypothetical protein KC19_5G169700 [Ceratodon purpureus]|uniref:BHLH domain-containing protein n=1 Tax=Ceratodon purpureus TaxID=3225 RepID=A0A8T0I3Q5_CERPU|nr:hypothetical protein KC19_5G169700 [Ceratodon purpureus]